MTGEVIAGRVWKFGDDINTDLMLPSSGGRSNDSEEEQARQVFSANRPGWVDLVQPGDFIVGGRNFGTGSSRPAARALRHCGIACLLADSITGLFFRNCVNYGLLALECAGISEIFEEGQVAEVMLADFSIRNPATGVTAHGLAVPGNLLAMMRGGGLYPILEQRGLIRPLPATK